MRSTVRFETQEYIYFESHDAVIKTVNIFCITMSKFKCV